MEKGKEREKTNDKKKNEPTELKRFLLNVNRKKRKNCEKERRRAEHIRLENLENRI